MTSTSSETASPAPTTATRRDEYRVHRDGGSAGHRQHGHPRLQHDRGRHDLLRPGGRRRRHDAPPVTRTVDGLTHEGMPGFRASLFVERFESREADERDHAQAGGHRRAWNGDGFQPGRVARSYGRAIIGVLAAVTIPSLLRAKMSGNEVSAIGSLRTINTAEAAYADVAASGAYATQLSVLTQPCPGGSQGFLSTEFAADPSQKSGYVIVLDPGSAAPAQADCNGVNTRRGYYLTGEPITANRTGITELRHVERGGHLLQSVGRTADRGTDWPRGRRDAHPVVRSAQFCARGRRPARRRFGRLRAGLEGDGKLMACATRAALP